MNDKQLCKVKLNILVDKKRVGRSQHNLNIIKAKFGKVMQEIGHLTSKQPKNKLKVLQKQFQEVMREIESKTEIQDVEFENSDNPQIGYT